MTSQSSWFSIRTRIGFWYKSIIINETQKYIELQYRTARLSQIAEDFNLSLPALSKLIKEGTGNTFQELLMKKRFERAAELLIDTNLPVEEIALNVGYENQSYFHRQFKMRYNITPRRYRLVHRRKMGRWWQEACFYKLWRHAFSFSWNPCIIKF